MPRDASGNYSLPEPLVVAGQTILADWANNSFADFSTTFTDSLSRNGNGGMLAQLRIAAGSAPAPSISWTNETTSGLYRFGTGDVRMSVQGVDVTRWNAGKLQRWTGSAWEDFLTSSTGGLVPGTTPDASLRWSGTQWVQNANVTMTAAGAMKITGALTGVTNLTMNGNLSLTGGDIVALGAIEMGGTLASTGSADFTGNVSAAQFVGGGAGITGILGTAPAGGTTSQALVKQSNANYDFVWATVEGGGGGLVDSVFGRLGDVVALQGDYAAFYATTAQGLLANTALQPNDDITELTNNAGFITVADIPDAPVQSVFGRTDAVTADGADYATFYLGINAAANDSNRLNNQLATYYTNSTNQVNGTLPVARLSGTYNIDISGDAATVDGTSIEVVSVLPGVPDLNTIYFVV